MGPELEFVLVAPDGSRGRAVRWQGYGVRSVLDVARFLTDVEASFAAAGVPIDQLHAEYGADQFEISLAPADPLLTADRTVLARILLGRAAARHGFGVSFSPVPFAGGAGNGAHLHLSLADAAGPLLSGGTGSHGLTDAGARASRESSPGCRRCRRILAGSVLSRCASARQLGRGVRLLGSGEPRGGRPAVRRHGRQPARRERGAQVHRRQREPLPGRYGVPRAGARRHRAGRSRCLPR